MEKALNNEDLLQEILSDTLCEIGASTATLSVFAVKGGEVILQLAQNGRIDKGKILRLVSQCGDKAGEILAHTAICLMEDYGIVKGGPKI